MLTKLHYKWWIPYAFVLPGFLLYVFWMVYPLFFQIQVSFYDWKILAPQNSKFIGWKNYQEVLTDPIFGIALKIRSRTCW